MLNTSRRGFLRGIVALGVTTAVPLPILKEAEAAAHVVPDGWLLCFGQEISRTKYADLFAMLKTSYGAGDGKTTFRLPDLRPKRPLPKNAVPLVHIIGTGTPTAPLGVMTYHMLATA